MYAFVLTKLVLVFIIIISLVPQTVVTDFLVVQLQSRQVLSGLRELSLLHSLSHKPRSAGD